MIRSDSTTDSTRSFSPIPELSSESIWLALFPEEIRSRIASLQAENGQGLWCAAVDKDLSQFKLNALSCLRKIERTMLRLSNSLPPPGRIIWCLENRETRGLEDFEAIAVFGSWLEIDLVAQVGRGSTLSRIILSGCLRETNLGLWFRLGPLRGPKGVLNVMSLAMIKASGMPAAAIAIGSDEAEKLSEPSFRALASMIRHMILKDSSGVALFVSRSRSQAAFQDLQAETNQLRQALGVPCRIHHICFEGLQPISLPGRLGEAMRNAHLRMDSSLIIRQIAEEVRERPELPDQCKKRAFGNDCEIVPFLGGGAYQCQPFDIRMPAGFWNPDGFLELPRLPVENVYEIADRSRASGWRRRPSMSELAQLLDWGRMEKYHQESGHSVRHAQLYHNFRIYNWPPPDASPRTVLVDCGSLAHPGSIAFAIGKIARICRRLGAHCRIVGAQELLSSAQTEATKRAPSSVQVSLQQQVQDHGYLVSAPLSGELRQDVLDFLEFLPRQFGRTLELGSGTGQLANVLAERATFLTCLDLRFPEGRACSSPNLAEAIADIHDLPCINNTFDSVIASNILEHLYDPVRSLREARRVLRPDGRLYALIPLDALNPEYDLRTHLWKADAESIKNAFAASEFEMVRCEIIDIYALGVAGCFPTCNGLVCKVEARKPPIEESIQ
jgi:SAM-dependent methyltransferase